MGEHGLQALLWHGVPDELGIDPHPWYALAVTTIGRAPPRAHLTILAAAVTAYVIVFDKPDLEGDPPDMPAPIPQTSAPG